MTDDMTDGFVSIDGLNELLSDLARIEEPAMQKSIAKRAMGVGLRHVRDKMKAGAPIPRPSFLRNHIKAKTFTGGGIIRGEVGVFDPKHNPRPSRNGREAPPSTAIARWIEYGTVPHRVPSLTVGSGRFKRSNVARVVISGRVFSRIDHPGITAKPWLRPAFDQNKDRALELIEKELVRLIRKELKA